jgi:hypothetical protein
MNPARVLPLLLLLAAPAFAQEKPRTKLVIPVGEGSAEIQTNGSPQVAVTGGLDAGVRKTIEDFFGALQGKEIDGAYERLTRDTKIAEKPEDVTTLKAKTQQAIELFGEITGAEQIGVHHVGTHLLSTTWLSLGKDLPLRWRFYFYKAAGNWRLIDIRVDDRLMELFGESAAESKPANWPKP